LEEYKIGGRVWSVLPTIVSPSFWNQFAFMLNEYKPALLPSGGTSRVAKCYSTPFITNFVKNWFKELLPQVSFIWENAGSYE
jgi:hypothetical protein